MVSSTAQNSTTLMVSLKIFWKTLTITVRLNYYQLQMDPLMVCKSFIGKAKSSSEVVGFKMPSPDLDIAFLSTLVSLDDYIYINIGEIH